MTTKREQLITALVSGLRIEEDPYAIETVKESTEFLQEHEYLDFYQSVMKEDSFGNGIKAVLKIAEQFKPQQQTDELEEKAKELIALVHAMNTSVYQTHIDTGVSFETLLDKVTFTSLSEEDEAVLNMVKPCEDLKALVAKDNSGWSTVEQLNAYKSALKYKPTDLLQIGDSLDRLRIRR